MERLELQEQAERELLGLLTAPRVFPGREEQELVWQLAEVKKWLGLAEQELWVVLPRLEVSLAPPKLD